MYFITCSIVDTSCYAALINEVDATTNGAAIYDTTGHCAHSKTDATTKGTVIIDAGYSAIDFNPILRTTNGHAIINSEWLARYHSAATGKISTDSIRAVSGIEIERT